MKFIVFFLLFNTLFANQGVEAYKNHDYQKAITFWQQDIRSNQYEKSELFFNIGNAYFKQKKYVEAILFYNKSLKVNYNNLKAKTNLDLAIEKQKISEFTIQNDFLDFFKRLVYFFKLHHLQWIIIFCLWCLSGIFILNRFYPFPKKRIFTLFFLTMLILASVNLYFLYQFQNAEKKAIVKEPTEGFEDINLTKSKKNFKGGETIEIVDQLKNASQIKISDGQILWISNSKIYNM